MRILFLSRWFPYPADNGSRLRVFNLLKCLGARHEVDLLSFSSEPPTPAARQALGLFCRRVEAVPFRDYQPTSFRALAGLLSPLPRSVVDTHSPAFAAKVVEWGRAANYDLVIASELGSAPYALLVPGVRRVLEGLEVSLFYEPYAQERRLPRKLRHGLTWWKTQHYLRQLARGFAGCTVVSARELERVRLAAPEFSGERMTVIPNGVDIARYQPGEAALEPDSLVYSGALTYHANFDAVDFFLREVFPRIRAQRPQTRLYITGATAGVPLERLPADPQVTFTGYLDDIRPRMASAWCSIVPLRRGSGTRLKILEALALGTPVVATPKGAEGLDLTPGDDLLIAEDPAQFADAVVRLLADPALRARLSAHGRQTVAAGYDWQRIGQALCQWLEGVVMPADAGQTRLQWAGQ